MSPLHIMLGLVRVIDPADDPALRDAGVAMATTWVEALSKLGHVGAVGPLASGSIGFAPSEAFRRLATDRDEALLRMEVLEALFPQSQPVPGQASVAVAQLRREVAQAAAITDVALLDVVLRELHDVCERDCRHAAIALCGKLLELALGALLVQWRVNVAEDASLRELINLVEGRASAQQPDPAVRARAREVLGLGVGGLVDLVRTVRNGAVHARPVRDGGRRIELPSREQSEAVVLLTVDLFRRFVLPPVAPA